MAAFAPTTDIGPLLLAAVFQLAGIVTGAALRDLVRILGGSDPRRVRLWGIELTVIAVFAAALGGLFAIASDVAVVGPPFGAALTAYAALSGAYAYLASRRLAVPNGWLWAAGHGVACVAAGTVGFATAAIITGSGTR